MSQKRRKARSKKTHSAQSSPWLIMAFALILGGTVGVGIATLSTPDANAGTPITVWKSPTCGCCSKWVEHLENHGFTVTVHDRRDMDTIKRDFDIERQHQSCHTARVDGYLVEGHVPASDIHRLLAERPDIRGLAVPGMPMGSPGMEGPRKDRYDVVTMGKDGAPETVFSQH